MQETVVHRVCPAGNAMFNSVIKGNKLRSKFLNIPVCVFVPLTRRCVYIV